MTPADQQWLLALARSTIEASLAKRSFRPAKVPTRMQAELATFVTLKRGTELRGCIGTLEAYRPLYLDVMENAKYAARDHRFPPVTFAELPDITIEVSVLTPPRTLAYKQARELLTRLTPEHGVILCDKGRCATFLPQVWDELPTPAEFLMHLCMKAGLAADAWRTSSTMRLQVYTVESFEESEKD